MIVRDPATGAVRRELPQEREQRLAESALAQAARAERSALLEHIGGLTITGAAVGADAQPRPAAEALAAPAAVVAPLGNEVVVMLPQ